MGNQTWGIPRDLVRLLVDECGLNACIETGSHLGESAAWLAGRFSTVVTIEAFPPLAEKAARRLEHLENVRALQGDSRALLPPLIADLSGPVMFWLDGHFCGSGSHGEADQCPLLEELAAIGAAAEEHVVLIDDARLFLAPPLPPLRAESWPTIDQVCLALNARGRRKYIVIHDDVIIAVPQSARPAVQSWIQGVASRRRRDRLRPLRRLLASIVR